ncbi:hypothetical protein KOW79_003033 [Hemibagrus wyckioides]|uniref:Uncharacterized protein n=1 Tax=Hemibagrus wyckioides TaxID=337641 RepID=A0A9D3SVL8_9TELE|nr:hypothetical protein KOW79_003033 [Hemibagrus wyckioides]
MLMKSEVAQPPCSVLAQSISPYKPCHNGLRTLPRCIPIRQKGSGLHRRNIEQLLNQSENCIPGRTPRSASLNRAEAESGNEAKLSALELRDGIDISCYKAHSHMKAN